MSLINGPDTSWQLSRLRLTLFTEQPSIPQREEWWRAATGQEPERVEAAPRQNEWRVAGPIDEGDESRQLALTSQGGRLDWVLEKVTEDILGFQLPVLGEVEAVSSLFLEVISGWLVGDAPPSVRVAFGPVYLREVADRETGYKAVSKLLDFDIPDGSSDFRYQINRPREALSFPDGRINRLSKWSVAKFESRSVDLITGETSVGHQVYAARLELDVNTAAGELGVVAGEDLLAVVSELVQLSDEIATQGDVP